MKQNVLCSHVWWSRGCGSRSSGYSCLQQALQWNFFEASCPPPSISALKDCSQRHQVPLAKTELCALFWCVVKSSRVDRELTEKQAASTEGPAVPQCEPVKLSELKFSKPLSGAHAWTSALLHNADSVPLIRGVNTWLA